MERRKFLSRAAALGVAAMLAGPALAADGAAEAVMRQLRALGYADVDAARTLLGRTRITAERGAERREIVLDPRSGEILRDLSTGGVSVLGSAKVGGADPRGQSTSEGSGRSGSDDSADGEGDDSGGDDSGGSGSSAGSGSSGGSGGSGSDDGGDDSGGDDGGGDDHGGGGDGGDDD